MITRNGQDWLKNCLQKYIFLKKQLRRMQMRSGAYLNMQPVTFIVPVFPAWSFSQYHDLQGVFIHASSGSPLDTLLSGQHLVLHGWATGKWTGERGDYEWLTGKPVDGCNVLSFSDRSSGLQHASTLMHKKHHGVSTREGKHHIGQRTGEEKRQLTAS